MRKVYIQLMQQITKRCSKVYCYLVPDTSVICYGISGAPELKEHSTIPNQENGQTRFLVSIAQILKSWCKPSSTNEFFYFHDTNHKGMRPKHATEFVKYFCIFTLTLLVQRTNRWQQRIHIWIMLKSCMTKNVHRSAKKKCRNTRTAKEIRTCLSSNIADPSSNISSTEPNEADLLSFPTELCDLLPKIRDFNLFWFLFGDNAGGVEQWSDGMMSTTTHVVSSFNPLVFRACCKQDGY